MSNATAVAKVSATCKDCGRTTRPVHADRKGRPSRLPVGWWISPMTVGTTYTCPQCGKR